MADSVYDPEEKPKKPDGGHDHDPKMSDKARRAEVDNLEQGFAKPAADDPHDDKIASPADIKSAEKAAANPTASNEPSDQVGLGFNPKEKKRFSTVKSVVGTGRRRGLFGAGLAAIIVSLLVAAFLSLLPLKILHLVENLQNHFFATSENAVQNETEIMFSNYVKKYVIPSLSKCSGSTIDKTCNTLIGNGNNPVLNLYRAWGQAKIENKLADDYGIEFKKVGDQYFMKAPGFPDKNNGQNITQFKDDDGNLFKQVGRNEVRTSVRKAMENETKWKRVMYRFKVGRLLEHKYGIKRCIVACKAQDDFADWKDKKKQAAKTVLVQRVLEPHAEGLALVLQCVIDTHENCLNIAKGSDGKGYNGEKLNKFQKDLQDKLASLAERFGQDAVEKIIADAQTLADKGFTRYAVEKVVESVFGKVAGEQAGKTAANAAGDVVPVVGAINTAASVINTVKNAGQTIKYVSYAVNSAGMVQVYMTYRTHADELKAGHVDSELVGSFTSSLGPNQQKQPDGSMGGAGAEGTPLYAAVIDGRTDSGSSALLDSIFPKATAATAAADTSYKCDNGSGVPVGKLICPEEDLRVDNFITGISDVFKQPPLSVVAGLADVWNSTAGKLINFIGNTFGDIIAQFPGVKQIASSVGELVQSVFESIVKIIIPSPFSDNSSGGRNFDLAAGGADVAGNDFAHHGIGGRVLTNQEYASIVNEQAQQDQDNFQQQSLFAKMFDKDSQYSLVSKVAMAMPTNLSSTLSTGASSLLRNPFSAIVHGFGSLLSFGHVSAAGNSADMCTNGGPFGVTCYGYTEADLPQDPQGYWDKNCQTDNFSDNWNEAATKNVNPDTAQYENSSTNPCLLIQATVGSAGGYFSDSTLTPDDLGDSGVIAPGAPSTTGSSIVGNIGEDSDKIPCAAGTKSVDIGTTQYTGSLRVGSGPLKVQLCMLSSILGVGENLHGGKLYGGAVVNSRVSGAWQAAGEAAKAAGVQLVASSSFRFGDSCKGGGTGTLCAKPNSSPHQMGVAIDFQMRHVGGGSSTSCNPRSRLPGDPQWDWLFKNADKFGMKQYAYENWHWDPVNSSSRCGPNQ